MKIVFLGTNGWYTSPTGNTACVLLDTKDHYIIFDAGNGFYKLDQYITEEKPVLLFISHFHIDHVSGLHMLGKFAFPKGMDVYVGFDRKRDFVTLVNPPYTVGFQQSPENIHNLSMEVRLHELSDGLHEEQLPITVIPQTHGYRDHAYRIVVEGKVIAYSGDCGISENSRKLAQNADVLIHECSLVSPAQDVQWGHVNSLQAAELAKQSNVKKLILTHFDAKTYDTLDKRVKAEKQAQEIFPNTTAAYDDMVVEI